jgi:hypothetical protein
MGAALPAAVIAGLDPAIHRFAKGWMPGSSPGMTPVVWRPQCDVAASTRSRRYFSSTKIEMSNLSSGVVTGSVWYSSMKVPDGSSCFSSRYSGIAL